MADPKKSPEIVTEQELKPVLENKAFDATTFLRLYNEWKATWNWSTFAALRKMHEDAGYNNKNTLFGAEWEMHEIAAIVQRYQDGRVQIAQTTASSTATTAADVTAKPVVPSKTPDAFAADIEKELSAIEENNFASFKSAIEKSLILVSAYEKMQPQHREAVRGSLGVMILERLAKADYRVTLSSQNIEVKSEQNPSGATQLETFLRSQNGMKEVLAYGLIYRSSEFKNYSEIYLTDDKKNIKDAPRDYLDYLKDAHRGKSGSTLSQSDQDLEKSRIAVAAIIRDPNTLKWLIVGVPFLEESLRTVSSNPQLQSAVATAAAQTASSTPQVPNSSPSSSGSWSSGQLPDWDKDPINRTLAEIGQGFTGGLNKMMNTPGAFGGLIIATIATMIFGGFKKWLMVLAGGVGLSGIMDRLDKNGVMPGSNPATPASAPTTTPAATAVAAPAAGPRGTFDDTNLSNPQKKGIGLIRGNSSLLLDITNFPKQAGKQKQNATLDDYLTILHKDSIQNITLDKIIYTSEHERSIFSEDPKSNFPTNGDITDNISRYLLKKVIRSYLGENGTLSSPTASQKEGQQTLDTFKAKYPEATWKTKTLKDLINEIHK